MNKRIEEKMDIIKDKMDRIKEISLDTINNKIALEYDLMKDFAIAKNISYNGSIFNSDWIINVDGVDKHKQVEIGIIARVNDKLNRINKVGLAGYNEDNLTDLIGYLMLLKIHHRNINNDDNIKLKQKHEK